jgi:hypothetical protein
MTVTEASEKAGMFEPATYNYHKRPKEQYRDISVPRPVAHYK